jgi:hypothetical protein
MARPENPQPAQIAHALERPRTCSTNRITTHRLTLKHGLPTVHNRIRRREPAEPVADPVCVARPDEGCDA